MRASLSEFQRISANLSEFERVWASGSEYQRVRASLRKCGRFWYPPEGPGRLIPAAVLMVVVVVVLGRFLVVVLVECKTEHL